MWSLINVLSNLHTTDSKTKIRPFRPHFLSQCTRFIYRDCQLRAPGCTFPLCERGSLPHLNAAPCLSKPNVQPTSFPY